MTNLLEMIKNNEITSFPCFKGECFHSRGKKCFISADYQNHTCPVIKKMSDEKNLYQKDSDGGAFMGCEFCKHLFNDCGSDNYPCLHCLHYDAGNDVSKFVLQLEYKEEQV